MDSGKRKRDREDMDSRVRVTSRVRIDGEAIVKGEENETEEIQENEEIEEEVVVMKAVDQPVEEEEEHDLWWDNDEESDVEHTPVPVIEMKRCSRVFRYGDDSTDVSSDYDSDNYALSCWKDA